MVLKFSAKAIKKSLAKSLTVVGKSNCDAWNTLKHNKIFHATMQATKFFFEKWTSRHRHQFGILLWHKSAAQQKATIFEPLEKEE